MKKRIYASKTIAQSGNKHPVQKVQKSELANKKATQNAMNGTGQPLDQKTQTDMESAFGHDFSQVRVHDGTHANQQADQLNAKAFTSDTDIAFGMHQYAPQTVAGKKLIAHELTHVVQQAQTKSGNRISSEQAEHEAKKLSTRVTKGHSANVQGGMPTGTVQKEGAEEEEEKEFQLQEPTLGQSLPEPESKLNLGLPQLELDPMVDLKIRSLQRKLTYEQLISAVSQKESPLELALKSAKVEKAFKAFIAKVRRQIDKLSTGQKIAGGVIILGTVLSTETTRKGTLDLLQDKSIPLNMLPFKPFSEIPLSVEFNVTGEEQKLFFKLDVGKLLPKEFGFSQ